MHQSGRPVGASQIARARNDVELRWDEDGWVPAPGRAQCPLVDYAAAGVRIPGQDGPGNSFAVIRDTRRVVLALAHGMGTDTEAAADTCRTTVEEHCRSDVVEILHRADEALRDAALQAVMTVASVDPDAETVTWAGMGSVSGTLLRGSPTAWPREDAALVLGGVLGGRLPAPQASVRQLGHGDLLLLSTRGLAPCDPDRLSFADSTVAMARRIRDTTWNHRDDAVLLLARYLSTRFTASA